MTAKPERATGTLSAWDGEKGAVTPSDGAPTLALHPSGMPRGVQPVEGDLVTFEVGTDARGRKTAVRVLNAEVRSARNPGQSLKTHGDGRRASMARVRVLTAIALLVALGWLAFEHFK